MAYTFLSSDVTGGYHAGSGEDVVVLPGVNVTNSGGHAIEDIGAGGGAGVIVHGTVSGSDNAIHLIGQSGPAHTGDHRVVVAPGGAVSAENVGIQLFQADNQVANSGYVYGGEAGVAFGTAAIKSNYGTFQNDGTVVGLDTGLRVWGTYFAGSNAGTIEGSFMGLDLRGDYFDFVNSGTIIRPDSIASTHQSSAISISGSGGTFVNTGTIAGGMIVYDTATSSPDGFRLFNSGLITVGKGLTDALTLQAGRTIADDKAHVRNTGTIIGDVALGLAGDTLHSSGTIMGDVDASSGNDTVILRRAGIVTGTITLGHGNDSFTGAAADDTVQGGEGNDTLNGRGGDDTLDGDTGRDTILGRAGDDVLRGGRQNDVLNGGRGDDVLQGESQRDTLYGGAGNDVLIGGTGGDLFVMHPHTGHDRITDWQDGSDQIDLRTFHFASFSDVAALITTSGNSATIALSADTSLTLEAGAPFTLDAADFLL